MLNRDFKELLQLFNAKSVEYLVVGGYAMAVHGHPRFTGDLDLWIWSNPQNSTKIMESLRGFGFGTLGLTEADFETPSQVIQLGYPPSRIDLLTDIDGVNFEECWARRVTVLVDEVPLPLISKADLIRNKRSTGRLQDLADLEKLGATDQSS